MSSRGVVYVATGGQYVEEAYRSAESLRQQMPRIPVTLFSDQKIKPGIFDNVTPITAPCHSFEDKIVQMGRSPYQSTLFLDSDTYVADDLSELFTLLDEFEIAAAHAATRKAYPLHGIPESFPEFNSGVILFKRNPGVENFFKEWLRAYEQDLKDRPAHALAQNPAKQHRGVFDQPSFREALYRSRLRIAVLTPEYNCRVGTGSLGYVSGVVKVLHGRHPDLAGLAQTINGEKKRRLYKMTAGALEVVTPQGELSSSRQAMKPERKPVPFLGSLKKVFQTPRTKESSEAPALELLSLHIPKTAGTSFREILKAVYGEAGVVRVDIPLPSERAGHEPAVKGPERLPSLAKVIHGHFCYQDILNAYGLDRRIPLITWVRDPVKRVISNYFYLHKILSEVVREDERDLNILSKMERSLMEYAASEIARNRMSKFLKGIDLGRIFFVGVQERFQEDLADLSCLLGWKSYGKLCHNVTGEGDCVVSERIEDEIHRLNLEDAALYDEALALREKRRLKMATKS